MSRLFVTACLGAILFAVAVGPVGAQDIPETTARAAAICAADAPSPTIVVTLSHSGPDDVTATVEFRAQSRLGTPEEQPVGYVVDLAAGQTIKVPRTVADDFYVIEVVADAVMLEPLELEAFCDRGSVPAAAVRSYCAEAPADGSGADRTGAFEFRLFNPAGADAGASAEFTISVTGLANRRLMVDDVTTAYRTGRRDGEYQIAVVADGQTRLNQTMQIACSEGVDEPETPAEPEIPGEPEVPGEPNVATSATSTADCLEAAAVQGVIATTISNGSDAALNYVIEYSGRTSPAPREGTLDAGETATVRRSGRPDGDYAVAVEFRAGGPDEPGIVARQELVVACESSSPEAPGPEPEPPAQGDPTASVEVLCVNNDGLIRFHFSAGTADRIFTAQVQGLTDRSITVEAGGEGRIGRSGRRDGDYAVAALMDGSAFLATAVVTVACDPPPTPLPPAPEPPAAPDVVDVIDGRADLTLFSQLLRDAEFADDLREMEQAGFTVFAPNDAAIAALGSETVAALRADPEALLAVLKLHVALGQFNSAAFAGGGVLQTLGGSVLIEVNSDGILTVGGAPIVSPDIAAGNGTIHVLGQVITPIDPINP